MVVCKRYCHRIIFFEEVGAGETVQGCIRIKGITRNTILTTITGVVFTNYYIIIQ
jgi:hypothetical protein